MEKEEIIILDEGFHGTENPDSFCCIIIYIPYKY